MVAKKRKQSTDVEEHPWENFQLPEGAVQDEQLCSNCNRIDFQQALSVPNTEIASWGIPITKSRTDFDPDCSLCTYVFRRVSTGNNVYNGSDERHTESNSYHWRVLECLWPLKIFRSGMERLKRADNVIAAVCGPPANVKTRSKISEGLSRAMLLPLVGDLNLLHNSQNDFIYRGCVVRSSSPDYHNLRGRVDRCYDSRDGHNLCKQPPVVIDFKSRVIDCKNRKIVPLKPGLTYIALSYVWGVDSAADHIDESLSEGASVPLPVAQTIEDAMIFVQRLGERYLWVDRFCIWRSENKHLQIEKMHKIYQGAKTTIVALNSENADSGLTGVSRPRTTQQSFHTRACCLVSNFANLSHHMSTSIWSTRGWTYQEALLSRSCLFFTQDQIYFACKTWVRSEDVEQSEIQPAQDRLGASLFDCDRHGYGRMPKAHVPESFAVKLMEYTRRSLTFDSDALNAFKGIIAVNEQYTY